MSYCLQQGSDSSAQRGSHVHRGAYSKLILASTGFFRPNVVCRHISGSCCIFSSGCQGVFDSACIGKPRLIWRCCLAARRARSGARSGATVPQRPVRANCGGGWARSWILYACCIRRLPRRGWTNRSPPPPVGPGSTGGPSQAVPCRRPRAPGCESPEPRARPRKQDRAADGRRAPMRPSANEMRPSRDGF